jgi:hypothetical protein
MSEELHSGAYKSYVTESHIPWITFTDGEYRHTTDINLREMIGELSQLCKKASNNNLEALKTLYRNGAG